jgi:C4-dicarboxylate transporter DctQ subunit
MRREHSAFLGMRFDYLYSVYVLFAIVCILRQMRVAWQAWRGAVPPTHPGEHPESAVP